jgi:transposase-like protein
MLELSPVVPFQPRKSTRRDPWSEAEARAVLAAASRSGLSLAAFARRHDLPDRTLYWWQSQLRTHPNVEPAPQSFARICTHALLSRETTGVEIVVSEAVIRVSPGFCPQTLAQVVAALRPC